MPGRARRLRTPGRRRPALFWAAILLALAVGLALGGGVIARFTADRDVKDLRGQVEQLEGRTAALDARAKAADSFADAAAPTTLGNSLSGYPVLLVLSPTADGSDVAQISRRITQAGGTVAGRVSLTPALYDESQSERLRGVVDNAAPSGTTIDAALVDPRARTGDLLGTILLSERAVKPESSGRADALAALQQAGFLSFDGDSVPGARAAVVVTGGAVPEDQAAQGQAIGRLAAGLSAHGDGTVLAARSGSATGAGPIVVVRQDTALTARLATVDDADTTVGQVSTALALIEATRGRVHAYGSGIR